MGCLKGASITQIPRSYSLLNEYAPQHVRIEISIIHFLVLRICMCIFIKAIICHVKQLLQHKEKLSNNMAFGNGDIFLLMSFSSISLYPLSNCLLLQCQWAMTVSLTSDSVCCWTKAELGTGPSVFSMSSAIFMENCSPLLSLLEAPSTHIIDHRSDTFDTSFFDDKEQHSLPEAVCHLAPWVRKHGCIQV